MTGALFAAVLGFANLLPQRALEEAVNRSPDVAAARARVDQSASLLAVARGGLVPALASSYSQAPQGNPPGPNIISRLVTVGLQTNVADFIAYGPTVRQGVLVLESSRADLAVAERDERVKTLGLYFDALKARAVASVRETSLRLAQSQFDAAQKRFAVGDAPRLDVVRADVAVARATADAEGARAADDNATEALGVETAQAPEDLRAMADLPLAGVPFEGTDPQRLVTRALLQRAEIASALAIQHAAEAGRRIAGGNRFPLLAITGGYTTGTDSDVPIGAPSVNVAFTLPLGASARQRVAVEQGRVAESTARVEAARRSVTLEVGSAARTLAALERAAAAATRARSGAEAEVAATELGYRSGASSSLDVEIARTTFAQASIDESSTRYDVERARAVLVLEVGP